MNSIGLGCGRPGCTCEYCNGDNYDRYIGDHLRNILDELNTVLSELARAAIIAPTIITEEMAFVTDIEGV